MRLTGPGGASSGCCCCWHVRGEGSEEFLLALPGNGGRDDREGVLLKHADEGERQLWIEATVEAFGATVAPLVEAGEERGLAERAAMGLKARVGRSLAGDGARNVAARLPPTEAVALFDFVADHPDDLALTKGSVVVLTSTDGEWWHGHIVGAPETPGMFPAAFVARGEGAPEGTAPPPMPMAAAPEPEPEPQPEPEAPAIPVPVSVPAIPSSSPIRDVGMLQKRFQRFDVDKDGVLVSDRPLFLLHYSPRLLDSAPFYSILLVFPLTCQDVAEVATLVKQLGFEATAPYVAQLVRFRLFFRLFFDCVSVYFSTTGEARTLVARRVCIFLFLPCVWLSSVDRNCRMSLQMSKFDLNNDGVIDEGEFVALFVSTQADLTTVLVSRGVPDRLAFADQEFMQSHLAVLDALDEIDLEKMSPVY